MIVDAHNHLHLLEGTDLHGYGIDQCVTCGTSPSDWDSVLELAQADAAVVPAIGLHPWFVDRAPPSWLDQLGEKLLSNPRACVGEIGLDRTRRSPALPEQRAVLAAQLDLAADLDRPAVLHCVRAFGSLLEALGDRHLPQRGIMLHGWAGAAELIPRFLELPVPVYFSVSSADQLELIPEGRLLVESDASPDNGRTPAFVSDFIAENRIDAKRIARNYRALFGE